MTIPPQRGPWAPARPVGQPQSPPQSRPPDSSWRTLSRAEALLLLVGTAVLVHLLGVLALALRPEGSSTAAWWPATGVAVAAVAIATRRLRLPVVLAAGCGALTANLTTEWPWPLVIGLAVAHALTPLVWIWVMTRGRDGDPVLRTTEDYSRFVLATFAANAVAGLVAAACTAAAGIGGTPTVWASFVAAQSAAILILVPLVLPLPGGLSRPHPVEASAQVAALVGTVFVAFGPQQTLPLSVLPLPILIWAAVRLPVRWVSAELVGAGVLMSALTTLGKGPYADIAERGFAPELVGLLLQVALVVYALVTLPLALTVHQQATALASARESYELVQNVLTGATGTAIIGCDPAGMITVFNAGAEQMLGYAAEEMVGRCTPERFHLADELAARAADLGVPPGPDVFTTLIARGAGSDRRDWTLVRKDGSRLTASLRLTSQRKASGELAGYLAVGEDVTERRRTEAALRDALERERDAVERMEQLDKAKTMFVSSVSHELRTPMTSVLGYTDMLLGEGAGPVTPEQRGMLEAARRNARRLLRLIEDLLTVSLIENGTFTIDVEPVDLRTAARDAVEAARPLLAGRDLALHVDPGPRELMVVGDLDHLGRVALNLLANAVKFTPDGGRVDLRLRADGDTAVLEVSDTGVGIPEAEQPRLFERFYRTTTAQDLEVPGTGLGLSIVKTIVVSHGGCVDVQSRSGGGTTFRVMIPLRQPAGVTAASGDVAADREPHPEGGEQHRVTAEDQSAGPPRQQLAERRGRAGHG